MEHHRSANQRHRFTHREDHLLKEMADRLGTSSWERVALSLPGTSPRQCRERWKHFLAGCRDAEWTAEEDRIIMDKVSELGPKWTRIAALLEHRTDVQVKARWGIIFRQNRRDCFRNVEGARRDRPKRPRAISNNDEVSEADEKPTTSADRTTDLMDQIVFVDVSPFGQDSGLEHAGDRGFFDDFEWSFGE
jgi:hypothetical protein